MKIGRRAMKPGDTIFGRFEIASVAGRGAMGTVYRAYDRLEGCAVAVKLLRFDEEEQADRWRREVSLLAELSHPAIVRYIEHGTVPGESPRAFLVLEWLEGETLRQRLARGALGVPEVLSLGRRVASALAAAHARQMLHRDIKPENLLLVDERIDRVKVIDFGIARRVHETPLTASGVVVGTPQYLAPEQARGATSLDGRVDLFALGSVLHECLTGRLLWAGDDVMAVLAKILFEPAPPLPGVPAELAELVLSLLAKPKGDRPADALEVARALARMAGEEDSPPGSTPVASAPPDPEGLAAATTSPGAHGHRPRYHRRGGAPRPALSGTEQRFGCILFMRGGGPATSLAAALERVAWFGAEAEALPGGSLVVMLLGGDPTEQARRAARCALMLADLVEQPRIALVSGRWSPAPPTAAGSPLDQAAHLLGRTQSGAIRVDPATAALLDSRFALSSDVGGPLLLGELAVAEGARTVCGRATPCVGRERELAELVGLVDEALSEPVARAVVVSAPEGNGKTRLLSELSRRLDERGASPRVVSATGSALGAGSPYGVLRALLRHAAGLSGGDPAADHDGLCRRLAETVPAADLGRLAELLGGQLGAAPPGPPSPALVAAREDPRLMGDSIRAAWLDWLDAETAAGPLMIVVDDLQGSDRASLRLLDAALGRLRDRPLVVLALGRPELHDLFPQLWRDREVQEVRLAGLTRRASERLVREVLGPELDAGTLDWIVERAGGNPFYLEELVRAVAGGARELPDSVVGMIQARLDALDGEARRVLRAASVFGATFWRGGIEALVGAALPIASVDEWLADLVGREVITPQPTSRFAGEPEYSFRYQAVREAAYAALTASDRVLAHGLAGTWLERAGERDAVVLARHFEVGGERERAVTCWQQAAEHALASSDLEATLNLSARAVACGAEGERLGTLAFLAAQAHFWRGEYALAEQRADEAATRLPRGSVAWLQLMGTVMSALGHQGRYAEVRRVAEGIQREPTGVAERGAKIECLARAVGYLFDSGAYEASLALLEFVEDLAKDAPALEDRWVAGTLGQARHKRAVHAGDIAGQLAALAPALEALERSGDVRRLCEAKTNIGGALIDAGDFAAADDTLVEALAIARRGQMYYLEAGILFNLAHVRAWRGRLDEARALAKDGLELSTLHQDRRFVGAGHLYLATIAYLGGAVEESAQEARTAVAELAALPPLRASAQAALARALLAAGRVGEALACAAQAIDAVERRGGIEEYEALAHLVWAEALALAQRHGEARQALARAAARLHERAGRISDPSLRARFLEDVPDHRRTLELARAWGVGARL
jgi:tetratricopeptide (TPR) repeat protein